jgi:hypothetical protein
MLKFMKGLSVKPLDSDIDVQAILDEMEQAEKQNIKAMLDDLQADDQRIQAMLDDVFFQTKPDKT